MKKIKLTAREVMVLIDEMNKHLPEYQGKGFSKAVITLRSKQYRTPEQNALIRLISDNDSELAKKIYNKGVNKPTSEKLPLINDPEQLTRIEAKLDKLIKLWSL